MEILILKSAACLAILMVFYKLFLENLAIHKFKRFYLLGALVVSIIIPFITFIEYIEPVYDFGTFDSETFGTPPYFPAEILIDQPEKINYLPIILWSIYGLGVLLYASKFCINLFGIVSKINKNEKQKQGSFISVLLQDLIVPHTFFSYIFLNKTKFEANTIPQEVLLHEQTHASQKHSLDILFIELLQVVFWFNPLLYFIKKDIKLNHEFLADEAVLKQGIDSSTYQETLLHFTSNANKIPLAHAINYSLIKKRFTIMKTKTSKKVVWLRSLVLLPLLGVLLFSFSGREQVQKEIVPAMLFKEEMQNNNALTNVKEELAKINALSINYVIDKDEYYKNATFKFRDKNKNIIAVKSYNELSEIQKKRLPPPPSKPLKKQPSKKQLKDWQDSSKYGIWLDGKRIYNYALKNTTRYKLAHYFESKLAKNAVNYGEHYFQINLYSIAGFDNAYAESQPLKKGTEILIYENAKTLKNTLKESVNYVSNANYTENSTLTVNGTPCDGCKLNLSKKGVEKIILGTTTGDNILSFNIKFPGKPTVNIKGATLNTKAIKFLNEASLGVVVQLFNIKTVAKEKLAPFIITLVDKNDKNYSQSPMVKEGEASHIPPPTAYPKVKKGENSNIPPPPPPPTKAPQYVEGKKLTLNQIIEKTPKGVTSGYQMLENGESHYFTVYQGKKTYYNKDGYITDDKGKVLPPPPPAPPAPPKTVIGKASPSLKPPTPPEPVSREKHIRNMANKDASFYFNGEKISSDKALTIVSNNKNTNISTQTNNGKSTVHLSTKPISVINGKVEEFNDTRDNVKSAIEKDRNRLYEERKKAIEARKKQKSAMIESRKEMMKERKKMMKTQRLENSRPLHEQFKGMEKNGGEFFYEGDKISEAKAIALIKEDPKLNMSMHVNNGKSTIHLSKKGIKTVNGKLVTE